MDTQSMPIIRKKVKKLESQEEFESKRKWHKVTQALIRDDVEAASAAKHEVCSHLCVVWISLLNACVLVVECEVHSCRSVFMHIGMYCMLCTDHMYAR